MTKQMGAANGRSKLTDKQREVVRSLRVQGWSYGDIARLFPHITRSTVYDTVSRNERQRSKK